ncbi:hypothetical protein Asp14428_35390 [Actinoplanes sp. NBRC 14428]|nr:hypothetical protein Asp14428_35390 [Actinoplanes sp. NBRC 14428]
MALDGDIENIGGDREKDLHPSVVLDEIDDVEQAPEGGHRVYGDQDRSAAGTRNPALSVDAYGCHHPVEISHRSSPPIGLDGTKVA